MPILSTKGGASASGFGGVGAAAGAGSFKALDMSTRSSGVNTFTDGGIEFAYVAADPDSDNTINVEEGTVVYYGMAGGGAARQGFVTSGFHGGGGVGYFICPPGATRLFLSTSSGQTNAFREGNGGGGQGWGGGNAGIKLEISSTLTDIAYCGGGGGGANVNSSSTTGNNGGGPGQIGNHQGAQIPAGWGYGGQLTAGGQGGTGRGYANPGQPGGRWYGGGGGTGPWDTGGGGGGGWYGGGGAGGGGGVDGGSGGGGSGYANGDASLTHTVLVSANNQSVNGSWLQNEIANVSGVSSSTIGGFTNGNPLTSGIIFVWSQAIS